MGYMESKIQEQYEASESELEHLNQVATYIEIMCNKNEISVHDIQRCLDVHAQLSWEINKTLLPKPKFLNEKILHNQLTTEIAQQQYFIGISQFPTEETEELIRDKYRNDLGFHARVSSIVGCVMNTIIHHFD